MGEYVNLVEEIWETITIQDYHKLYKLLNHTKINKKQDRYGNGVVHLLRLLDPHNDTHLKYLNLILRHPIINLNMQNRNGETLLHIASYDIVKLLNLHKFFIDERDKKGKTPLMTHLEKGNVDTCLLLLKNGADVNLVDNDGNGVIHKIYWFNLNNPQLKSLFKLITKQIRNVNLQNNEGETLLHSIECPLMLQELFVYKLDINIRDKQNSTPLLAQISKNLKISELLIKNGADVNLGDDIQSPIHKLCDFNLDHPQSSSFFKMLINHPSIILDKKNTYGQTLLHLAKNSKIVEELLEHNVKINEKDIDGATPLMFHLAKDSKISALLINNGADINLVNNNEEGPIHKLWLFDNYVYQLIINHPDLKINLQNNKGETALHLIKTFEMAKDLLDRNIKINLQDKEGNSPLLTHLGHNLDICELLINRGCDINLANSSGNTALHLIGLLKITGPIFNLIINHPQININIKNNKSETILSFASEELVQELLDRPFDPELLAGALSHNNNLIVNKIYKIWNAALDKRFVDELVSYVGEISLNNNITISVYLYLINLYKNNFIGDRIFRNFFKFIKQPFLQHYNKLYHPDKVELSLFLQPYRKFSNLLQYNDVIFIFYSLNDCPVLRDVIKKINSSEIPKLGLNDSPFLYLITHPFNLNNLNHLFASKILLENYYHIIFEIQNIARFCTLTPDLLALYKSALKALDLTGAFKEVLNQIELNGPKTLLEISRNQTRTYLVKTYKIYYLNNLYSILNKIGLPELIKEIILLEIPLYQIEKPLTPNEMAKIFVGN